jgi:hypothetical protein
MLRTLYDVLNNHGLTLTAMIQRHLLNHENENATVFPYALEKSNATHHPLVLLLSSQN